jgi:hypothetical protein
VVPNVSENRTVFIFKGQGVFFLDRSPGYNVTFNKSQQIKSYFVKLDIRLEMRNIMKHLGQYTLRFDRDANKQAQIVGKGKEILLQAWTGRESSRRMRLPDFNKIDKSKW